MLVPMAVLGSQGAYSPRLCAFDNSDGAPLLRKNGKHANIKLGPADDFGPGPPNLKTATGWFCRSVV